MILQGNPYVGPRTFTRQEGDRFFGREREARELIELVEKERLVVFYAPSGAGKTSLINTRLIPYLMERNYEVLPVGRVSGVAPAGIHAENIYIYNLIRSLSDRVVDPDLLVRLTLFQFIIGLKNTDGGYYYEASASEMAGKPEDTPHPRVLIIDEFEELFATYPEQWEKRDGFFRQLDEAMQADPRLSVVLVMREDYIASLDPYAQLVSNNFRARYSMQLLRIDAALEAIKNPVQSIRPYASGVAEKLVDDLRGIRVQGPDGQIEIQLGQFVEPVQLQVVCYLLWECLPPSGNQITERDLQELSGVNEALGSYYDRRVASVAGSLNYSERSIRLWFEDSLISSGGIRNALLREPEKSGGLDNKVIDAFQGDLIRVERRGGSVWYELAHDRLVEPIIQSNRRWFEERISPLQRQAALWHDQGGNDQWLLTGQSLAAAEAWAKDHADEITENEKDFLAESRRLQPADIGESEVAAATPVEKEPPTKSTDVEPEMSDEERELRLQAAIRANILSNNRSQAVFNDRAQGDDQLGIKDEVEALAETLLLRDVEPPVAVGIMGGWGSGKSFVMYLISRYVEEIRTKPVKKGWSTKDKDEEVPAHVGHIYQISFNAWTYAKSNLWASLMDTIFLNLNRQMQIEQLLAHRDCSPKDTTNLAEDVRKSMLTGGKEFKKIYGENLKFDQDKELDPWKENLDYWAHHLFKGNLLWTVMRRRQEENLDRLKDTEEQLKQLKAGREQFEKSRSPEKQSIELNPSSKQAYLQTMKTVMVAFISDALSQKTKENLTQQGLTEKDIQQSWAEATGLMGAANTIATAFRNHRSYWFITLLFLAVTFVLPSLGTKLRLQFLTSWISQATTLFIAATPVIKALGSWAQKVITFNEKAKTILEDAYKNQQAKQAEEIANSTKKSPAQKIADLQKEVSQGSLAAYDTLINLLEAQAEAERQLIGPSAKYSSLMEFVQSRLDAATYENQLGLMHQVRQDIDELTYSLVDGAREDVFPRGKPRVILYIDDLDRCPPVRVVEILEAVQLLLSTKLFVIILGLDTRYVTRALEKEYKEILQHEGDPSGLDYIEKIIQIPYRVRPIERDTLQKYLAVQMDVEKPPEPQPVTPQVGTVLNVQPLPLSNLNSIQADQSASSNIAQTLASTNVQQSEPANQTLSGADAGLQAQVLEQTSAPVNLQPPMIPVEQTSSAADVQSQTTPVEQAVTSAVAQPPVDTATQAPSVIEGRTPEDLKGEPISKAETVEIKPLDIELPPAVIQFKHDDLVDLTACCQQIPLSPRSIKRLVNVFKLMKIFWFRASKDAGLEQRDQPRPVKQAAMCLLALASAYPEVMREVFVHLEGLYRRGQEQSQLFSELNNIKLPSGSAHELAWQLQKYKGDVSVLKMMAANEQEQLAQLTLKDFKFSTFNIVRSFSFVGDPVYWTDGEEDTSQTNGKEQAKPVTRTRKKQPLP